MEHLTRCLHSKWFNFYCGITLSIVFGISAYRHLMWYKHRPEWILLLFCFSELLTITFFIIRSTPKTVSTQGFDWIVAILGTFVPLFFRPALWGVAPLGKYASILGIIILIPGQISLNRSMAIVASKREIKTGGVYRFIRHPLYASYFLISGGYVLANTSIENVILYVISIILTFIRISREEKHLALDSQYCESLVSQR